MQEDGEAAPVQKSRQDEVLKRMFQKMDTKVEKKMGEGFSLDPDLVEKSDFHLQQYAKEHSRNAAARQKDLENMAVPRKKASAQEKKNYEEQRKKSEQVVEDLNKKALETATVVTGDGLENSRDRVKLLTEYRRSLIEGLPADLATFYKRSRDRSLSDEQQTKAREDFQRRFERLRDPKVKDRVEQTVQTISEVSRIRFEIDQAVANVEDRQGKPLVERFKSFWRGEINFGDMRTHFARWLSKKTGLRYEVFEDPKTMSSATREMMADGADGFELLSASVTEDIDKLTSELEEEERAKAEGVEEETPEEERERADGEQDQLSDDEKTAQERIDKITVKISEIEKGLKDGTIKEEDAARMIKELAEDIEPKKSVAELDKEQEEDIRESEAEGSEWTENIDGNRAVGLVKELYEGKSLLEVVNELFPGKGGTAKRAAFLQRFRDGMKTAGIIDETQLKSMKTADIERVFRQSVESSLDLDKRAKVDEEYKKYRKKLFWYYLLEGVWEGIKDGVRQGTAGTVST